MCVWVSERERREREKRGEEKDRNTMRARHREWIGKQLKITDKRDSERDKQIQKKRAKNFFSHLNMLTTIAVFLPSWPEKNIILCLRARTADDETFQAIDGELAAYAWMNCLLEFPERSRKKIVQFNLTWYMHICHFKVTIKRYSCTYYSTLYPIWWECQIQPHLCVSVSSDTSPMIDLHCWLTDQASILWRDRGYLHLNYPKLHNDSFHDKNAKKK